MPTPEGGLRTQPVGLDFGAVMLMGMGAGVDLALLSALLPTVEIAILQSTDADQEDDDADT